jgi:hypothetical protein
LNDLRMIDAAIDQYAIENGKKTGDPVGVTDWTNYVKKDSTLFVTGKDLFGNDYGAQSVDSLPKVSATSYNSLSDVADVAFWSPFGHN